MWGVAPNTIESLKQAAPLPWRGQRDRVYMAQEAVDDELLAKWASEHSTVNPEQFQEQQATRQKHNVSYSYTGKVQSHGVLLVLDEKRDYEIVGCSKNTREFLDMEEDAVMGGNFLSIFEGTSLSKVENLLRDNAESSCFIIVTVKGRSLSLNLSRMGDRLFCEMTPCSLKDEGQFMSHSKTRSSTSRLQLCGSCDTLLQIMVQEIGSIFHFDHVVILRFDPADNHGEIVAEKANSHVPRSILGLHFPATDIPVRTQESYYLGGTRYVCDVEHPGVDVLMKEGEPDPDLSRVNLRGIHPCHREYVQNFGVRATIASHITLDARLWGLVVCHHYQGPVKIDPHQVMACDFVVKAFSIRLAAVLQDLEFARNDYSVILQREIYEQISKTNDVRLGLTTGPSDMRRIVPECDGAAVIWNTQPGIATVGDTPSKAAIGMLREWACADDNSKFVSSSSDNPAFASDALINRTLAIHSMPDAMKNDEGEDEPWKGGVLFLRVKGGMLLWFKKTFRHTVAWALNRLKHLDDPHPGFQKVLVQYEGKCKAWTNAEVSSAKGLGQLLDVMSHTFDTDGFSSDLLLHLTHERINNINQASALAAELVNLIEGANAPIFGVNMSGVITQWNKMTVSLTGVMKEEALGQTVAKVLEQSPDAAETLYNLIQVAQQNKVVKPVQLAIASRGGLHDHSDLIKAQDTVFLFLGPTVTRDLGGRPRDIVFVGQDVTEVRATLARCMAIEAVYQRVISECASPIFGVSVDCRVTDWNAATAKMTKVPPERAMGMSLFGPSGVFGGLLLFEDGTSLPKLEMAVHNSFAQPTTKTAGAGDDHEAGGSQVELSFINAEGAHIHVLLMVKCARATGSTTKNLSASKGENNTHIVFFAHDVSETRALEVANTAQVAAQAASHAKSEQIGFLCHELRNPLNGVIGNISLLQENKVGEEEEELMHMTLQCCTQLMRIMNDVLDMSKVEAGKLQIERIRFNMSDLVNTIVKQIRGAAQAKGVQVHLSFVGFDDGDFNVESDPVRVQQVLWNFAWNAVKFTDEGSISFKIEKKECVKDGVVDPDMQILKLSVSDTGPGLSAQTAKILFQPYLEVQSVAFRESGGTGLGLSICKQLAELMGGGVGVESELEVGSTFWLELREKRVGTVHSQSDGIDFNTQPQAPRWKMDIAPKDRVVHSDVEEPFSSGGGVTTGSAHSTAHASVQEVFVDAREVLSMLDELWTLQVLREFREGDEAVVLIEVGVRGIKRQQYGSSILPGASAYADATQQALTNVAAYLLPLIGRPGVVQPPPQHHAPIPPSRDLVLNANDPRSPPFSGRVGEKGGLRAESPESPPHFPYPGSGSWGSHGAHRRRSMASQDDSPQGVSEPSSPGSSFDNVSSGGRASGSPHFRPPITPLASAINPMRGLSAMIGKGMKVLLVDDDKINNKVLERSLTKAGFVCFTASDGATVLSTIQKNGPMDCVLVDQTMKVMAGTAACRTVRKWEAQKGAKFVPFIATTGRPEEEILHEVWMSGMNGYLRKPVDVKSIASSLAEFLANPVPWVGSSEATSDEATTKVGCLVVFKHPLSDPDSLLHRYPVILVVDDEVSNNKLISRVLTRNGAFKVIARTDGSQALATLKDLRFKVDLVLMDEMMKNVNGSTATQEIRAYEAEHNMPATPILALTANSSSDIARIVQSGMDGCITKPLDVKLIPSTIIEFLALWKDRMSRPSLLGTPKSELGCLTLFAKPPQSTREATRSFTAAHSAAQGQERLAR